MTALSDRIETLKETNKDLMDKLVSLATEIAYIKKAEDKSLNQLESLKRKEIAIQHRERERLRDQQEKRLRANLEQTKNTLEGFYRLYELLKKLLETRKRIQVIQLNDNKKLTVDEEKNSNYVTWLEDEQSPDDLNESLLAEEMVTELFLSNWKLVEKGNSEVELQALLDIPYRDAKEKFNTRLNRPNNIEGDCFENEYHRILTSRFEQSDIESGSADLREPMNNENEPAVFNEKTAHEDAARIARDMIANLFMSNQDRIDNRTASSGVFKLLRKSFEDTCKIYESRVPEQIWKNNHYLKKEYARVLKERLIHSDSKRDNVVSMEHKLRQDNSIQSVNGSDHEKAVRIAKSMVSDLFFKNQDRIEDHMSRAEIREVLKEQYQLAVTTFESRIPEQTRKEKHHLEIAFEEALQEWDEGNSIDNEFEEIFREKFQL